jgi:diketogulonate reductase-like aldo/keto reductase
MCHAVEKHTKGKVKRLKEHLYLIEWKKILDELQAFAKEQIPLNKLNDLTIDTLYGSMYGLNHRYLLLTEALSKDFKNILIYSICRIKHLVEIPAMSFRPRSLSNTRQIGYGTYGWKYNPKLIRLALQKGILIDTAEGYGYGRVEMKIGQVIASKKYTPHITTKVARSHMSPQAIIAAAKRSQERLGVTFHYQLHFPNNKYTDEQIGEAFVSLRRAGIISSIGLGNCSIDMIESMQSFLSDYSGDIIRSVQVRYNLGDRRIEKTLLPYCQQRGILILAYSPLGQKFSQLYKPILDTIGKQYKCTAAQVALAWILQHRGVMPIPRTNNLNHMIDNINAVHIRLDEDIIANLNREFANAII